MSESNTTNIITGIVQLALTVALTYKYGAMGFAIAIATGNLWNIIKRVAIKEDPPSPFPTSFVFVWNAVLAAAALLLAYAFRWPGIVVYIILGIVASFLMLPIALLLGIGKVVNKLEKSPGNVVVVVKKTKK
jgi:hypothetical protein